MFIPQKQSHHIQHHLEIFFRDELLSWAKSAVTAADHEGINLVELREKVTTNVEQVIGRIKGIAPQCSPEEVLENIET